MRNYLLAVVLLGLGAIVMSPAPSALAADIGVTPQKARHMPYKRLRVVRDYDGTPVVVHRVRHAMVQGPYGTAIALGEFYHQPVVRPQPHYYFNGQPVLSRYLFQY